MPSSYLFCGRPICSRCDGNTLCDDANAGFEEAFTEKSDPSVELSGYDKVEIDRVQLASSSDLPAPSKLVSIIPASAAASNATNVVAPPSWVKLSEAPLKHTSSEKSATSTVPGTPVLQEIVGIQSWRTIDTSPPTRRTSVSSMDMLNSDSESEAGSEPAEVVRERKGGVCGDNIDTRVGVRPTYYAKDTHIAEKICGALSGCLLFKASSEVEIFSIAGMMPVFAIPAEELVVKQGDPGDSLFVVIDGSVSFYREDRVRNRSVGRLSIRKSDIAEVTDLRTKAKPRGEFIRTRDAGTVFGELAIMWNVPRSLSVYTSEKSMLAKLDRSIYLALVVRRHMELRETRYRFLRNCRLFEMLSHVQISQLVDALRLKVFEDGDYVISQGELGRELFVVQSGECVVMIQTGQVAATLQEHHRYHEGDFFGERALLRNQPRAANIIAVGRLEVLSMSRSSFERLLGPLTQLQEVQYLSDPRKLIADFYQNGDIRGPLGSLKMRGLEPQEEATTAWFAIFRPTSHEAIAKMLSREAVGKGLNVKGKSAKKNILSGFVPFVQISDNAHKERVARSSPPPLRGRVLIFYKTQDARSIARTCLEIVLQEAMEEDMKKHASGEGSELPDLLPEDTPGIVDIDDYAPSVYGLEVPDLLLCEGYIMRPDLSPEVGWETGRSSVPAFMEMNLHALRSDSKPKVVLYQFDSGKPMNPRGLLIAYAETYVKPVVSDFDGFLVGSRGMAYEPLPDDQLDLVEWSLDCTEDILRNRSGKVWTDQWLEKLKCAADEDFHPTVPEFGFGDSTSSKLIGDIIAVTASCGAIRHGAECFNFWFPQELDSEYLVVWHGFPEKPWDYLPEPALRNFLLDRVKEGYSFPLNPVWPLRDAGWYDVLEALKSSAVARGPLLSWYPEKILDRIESIFVELSAGEGGDTPRQSISARSVASDMEDYALDLAGCEVTDYALEQLSQYRSHHSHRGRKTTVTVMNFMRRVVRKATTARKTTRPSYYSTKIRAVKTAATSAYGPVSTGRTSAESFAAGVPSTRTSNTSGDSSRRVSRGRTMNGQTTTINSKFTARPQVTRTSRFTGGRISHQSHGCACCRWSKSFGPASTLDSNVSVVQRPNRESRRQVTLNVEPDMIDAISYISASTHQSSEMYQSQTVTGSSIDSHHKPIPREQTAMSYKLADASVPSDIFTEVDVDDPVPREDACNSYTVASGQTHTFQPQTYAA